MEESPFLMFLEKQEYLNRKIKIDACKKLKVNFNGYI